MLTNLKLKRLKLGMQQKNVAKAIGISKTYMSLLESGKEPLREDVLCKLAKHYNCSAIDLI